MHLLLGGASDSEVVGLAPARMVVIETDGSIAQEDTLRIAFDGAPATGLARSPASLDTALGLPGDRGPPDRGTGTGRRVPRLRHSSRLRRRPVLDRYRGLWCGQEQATPPASP